MSITAIIPARLSSTRLNQKLLIEVGGKTILQYVYENIQRSNLFDQIIIATDSDLILNHALDFGADVRMTRQDHQSGTDRVAEVAQKVDSEIIINVQGDEPLVDPSHLTALIELMKLPHVPIATLCTRFGSQELFEDPSNVKVVKDLSGRAMYFSRHAIPFHRDCTFDTTEALHHVGIYGFKRKTLINVAALPQGHLEKKEKLEQLRWMENGIPIYVNEVEKKTIGIDTKNDLEQFIKLLQK